MVSPIPLVFDPIYSQLPLPYRHRFPIEKYQGIHDALRCLGVPESQFQQPSPVTDSLLKKYFNNHYVEALLHGSIDANSMRRIGFPWSMQLVKRSLTAIGGTLLTVDLAQENGVALNLTGGYHHAALDYGSGFCLFNDLYLAAHQWLRYPNVDSVLIVDLDVHQGDGTALLAQHNSNIITLSLHGEKNFPHLKQSSDMDFPLAKRMEDEAYLQVLDEALATVERLYTPDAVIFDAGVDIHIDDELGLLNVSTEGVYQRDCRVIQWCKRHKLPVACVIGGGYQRNIDALVQVHLQLFKAAGVYG